MLMEFGKYNFEDKHKKKTTMHNPEATFEFNGDIARIKKNSKFGFIDVANKWFCHICFIKT